MQEQVLAVQRMQDYIDTHFQDEITMADLSRVSFFSPWYSYRLFQQYTGLTPSAYIRRLRLSKSALYLKSHCPRIADVAFELGFGSVDGYQRAFFREFGCNPSEYVKESIPIILFNPYGVKFREVRKEPVTMENLQCVFVQAIRKPERKVLVKRGLQAEDYFSYCEEVGCDVWNLLLSMNSLDGEPVSMWLPEFYKKPHTSTYVQGVEVTPDYHGVIPEGFDVIILPEKEYLMFQGEPFEEEKYCEAIQAVQQAMDRYDPSIIGFEWDDSSPRIQLEPRGIRGYIELRAVKRKNGIAR